jgi:beta-phosphoglucomutase
MKMKAMIFDMDGVITSSSNEHFLAWKELVKPWGSVLSDHVYDDVKGISRMESLDIVLNDIGKIDAFSPEEKKELADRKNAIYLDMIASFNEKNLFVGTINLLEALKYQGIKIALGSASKNGPMLLKNMGIMSYFDYIVNPANIQHGKPAPDIFLAAAEYFHVNGLSCVGVEDAVAGIRAIKTAGMFAIGIGDKEQLSQADVVYDGLNEIKLKEIEKRMLDNIF